MAEIEGLGSGLTFLGSETMLCLGRRVNETVEITCGGTTIIVHVCEFRNQGTSVRLAFEAPPHVVIHRGEVAQRIREENR